MREGQNLCQTVPARVQYPVALRKLIGAAVVIDIGWGNVSTATWTTSYLKSSRGRSRLGIDVLAGELRGRLLWLGSREQPEPEGSVLRAGHFTRLLSPMYHPPEGTQLRVLISSAQQTPHSSYLVTPRIVGSVRSPTTRIIYSCGNGTLNRTEWVYMRNRQVDIAGYRKGLKYTRERTLPSIPLSSKIARTGQNNRLLKHDTEASPSITASYI